MKLENSYFSIKVSEQNSIAKFVVKSVYFNLIELTFICTLWFINKLLVHNWENFMTANNIFI